MRNALSIVPVGPENLDDVLALDVHPDQRRHIETTRECLAEAAAEPRWRPVALVAGGVVIGFAMYGRFADWVDDTGMMQVWLDRLLIDGRHQGKGYGEEALVRLLDRLEAEYAADAVYLSVYADNRQAIALYEKHGFRFTGGVDTKGEKVMRRCSP